MISASLSNLLFTMSLSLLISKRILSSLNSPFFFISKLILLSTAVSTKQTLLQDKHNAITDFFLNQCGLSHSQLLTVTRRDPRVFRCASTHKAQQALQLLRDSGFTPHQVRNTILKYPSLLALKVDTQLKSKIQFIKTLGLSGPDLGLVISREPRILGWSLKKYTNPNIPLLEKLYGSKLNLFKALKNEPHLLLCDFEKQLKPQLEILKQFGIQGELLIILITRRPQVLLRNTKDSLKLKIQYVKNMGFLKLSKTFVYALSAVDINRPEMLEKKVKHLESIGLLEDEVRVVLKKAPSILDLSMDKMQDNMDFLTRTLGLQPSILVSHPLLLKYSIEKRMKPRYKVIEFLSERQPSKRIPSLGCAFSLSERIFVEKFLMNNPEAAELYEIYKGNPVDVAIS